MRDRVSASKVDDTTLFILPDFQSNMLAGVGTPGLYPFVNHIMYPIAELWPSGRIPLLASTKVVRYHTSPCNFLKVKLITRIEKLNTSMKVNIKRNLNAMFRIKLFDLVRLT